MITIDVIRAIETKNLTAVLEREPTNYKEYIQSWRWKERAEQMKAKAGYRCQVCHVSGYARTLHVHHNNYSHLGNELETDLIVLCADCHKMFYDSGARTGRHVWPTKKEFSITLKNAGVTYDNDDPWHYYEVGKAIIRHLNDEWIPEKYDFYNRINSDILYAALTNQDRRRYQLARENDWDDYETEHEWRSANDYWDGWGKS